MNIKSLGSLISIDLKEGIYYLVAAKNPFYPYITPCPIVWSKLCKFLAKCCVHIHLQEHKRAVFTLENIIFEKL